jgi:hypothetical protein
MSSGRAAISSGSGLVQDFDAPRHIALYLNFEIDGSGIGAVNSAALSSISTRLRIRSHLLIESRRTNIAHLHRPWRVITVKTHMFWE